jgi:hypothetical protein
MKRTNDQTGNNCSPFNTLGIVKILYSGFLAQPSNGERHALTLAALTLTLSHGWEREN